jgi:hypothetical protein
MAMHKTLLISLALVMAAIALAMGGVRGMHDGGAHFSAGTLELADGAGTMGMHDGGA